MKGAKIMEKLTVSKNMTELLIKNVKEAVTAGVFHQGMYFYYRGYIDVLNMLDLIGLEECQKIKELLEESPIRKSQSPPGDCPYRLN